MIQKTNKYMPRRNRYIFENILLNKFKFYILKYIIKIDKNLPFLIYFKVYKNIVYTFDEVERKQIYFFSNFNCRK